MRFRFSLALSFYWPCPGYLACNFTSFSLEVSISFFLPIFVFLTLFFFFFFFFCSFTVYPYDNIVITGCCYKSLLPFLCLPNPSVAQSAGAVEYTDCTSAEGLEPPHECPRYDTKQYDGEVPVMLGLWGIRSISSLPLLRDQLWPGVVAPDRVLSMR